MNHTKPIDQWIRINHILWTQNIVIGILSVVTVVSVVTILCFSFQKPLVIGLTKEKNFVFNSERKDIEIKDNDVKELVTAFINIRYNFEKFNRTLILQNLTPICSKGFIERLNEIFDKTMSEKNPPLRQKIVIEQVKITEKDILSVFDRVVTIDKLKVVMPLQIRLELIQGPQTKWNPLGLYINGVTEYENN